MIGLITRKYYHKAQKHAPKYKFFLARIFGTKQVVTTANGKWIVTAYEYGNAWYVVDVQINKGAP